MSEAQTLTPQGVLSFPHLFQPKPPAPGADPRFSCVLVFTPEQQESDQFKAMEKAIRATAKERFGDQMPRGLRNPIRETAEKKHFDNFPAGSKFVSLWSKQDSQPKVVDANVQHVTVPGDVFAGQIARASYRAFAYNTSGNAGVSLYLNNVQICKADAERLDGRMSAENEFDKVAGGTTPAAAGTELDDDDGDDPFG